MKNLKSVSILAAALLSSTVFAGGLGLGIGANVSAGVGAGLGGLGVQSGVSQHVDTQIDAGAMRTDARQSSSVPSDVGINQHRIRCRR